MSPETPHDAFVAGAAIMRSRIRELIIQRRSEVLKQTTPEGRWTMSTRVAELNKLYIALADIPLHPDAGS
jgi:hypothetical protein